MRKLIPLFVLCAYGMLYQTTYAQVTVNVNIASQPIWGPTGYDYVEYYYLPEIDVYYYVPSHKFIYLENGHWITRSFLPSRYRDYDLYFIRKVVLNEPKPYMHHLEYKERYVSSIEQSNQQSIRDSHESKYFENKNHPEHSKWKENNKNQASNSGHGKRHNK
jgi:hypothetical protein